MDRGTRFGSKKQFFEINGKLLWKHVFDKLNLVIEADDIVVVGVDAKSGITRSQSVKNGLRAINKKGKNIRELLLWKLRVL